MLLGKKQLLLEVNSKDAEQNVFSVNSNSTVSSLTFNSTSRTLSFSVTGDSGTTGYAQVYIAKTLVRNAEEIQVLLDENKLDHTVSSTDDSWLLQFVYNHSTHNIAVNLGSNSDITGDLFGNGMFYGIIGAILGVLVVVFILRKEKR